MKVIEFQKILASFTFDLNDQDLKKEVREYS